MLTTAVVAVSVAVPVTGESNVTRHWPEASVVHEYVVPDSWVAPLTRVAEAGETLKLMVLPGALVHEAAAVVALQGAA